MKSLQEERAALVPSPWPQQQRKDGGEHDPEQLMDEDDGDDEEDLQDEQHTRTIRTSTKTAEASSSAERRVPAWWRLRRAQKLLVPTRGVGLVIAGLLVLVLLLVVGGGGGANTSRRRWIHLDYASSFLRGGGLRQHQWPPHHVPSPAADLVPIPFSCGGNGSACPRRQTATSPPSPSPSSSSPPAGTKSSSSKNKQPPPQCPDYFRFIHSDLSPWRETGITREAVERGRHRAAFRLVVVDGRAYVETYHRVFQTRDTFTQWGIAQLLARYPGRVPDLDLMFNCEDMPEVKVKPSEESSAPPLFRYCKDDSTVDIVFPDWSFWGWPEVNIRPWAPLLEEMAAEMGRLPWADREPYAYWKGNPTVSAERADLRRCNDSSSSGGTRVFWQDWGAAIRDGFRDSNLAKQCRYRYKIYVRGRSWSVSLKYILACDSPVLLIATPFKDFFSRGLVAGRHYWPIDPGARKCADINFAVHDWGNAHPEQARRMAEEGSGFARHQLSMDYVYDYMLHLLTQYAGLLRYKPTVPENAVELCAETVACPAAHHSNRREFDFMMQSRERYIADYQPCTLPPPFTDRHIREMTRRDQEVRANVHKMMTTVTP
ncbi:uncharacterized protein LOC100283078 [Zea mays]|uniref:Lipopolysaccharide-modifying protein n=1 Tax=Zea mays TaxID=4577 RepID=K7V2W8_MAIZE|nr:uncharacterized protein LOC100283078 [Zea mays]AQK57939.1 Lipopolysaccharide-modifying protein [Zea mays]|eukprot:NP_001149452.2 uncharacterized protein LOC100283078 [Zea mays]